MLCYKRYTCYAYYTCSTHLTHKVHVIHVTDVRHVHDTQVANVAQAYKQVRPTCIILIRRVILLTTLPEPEPAGDEGVAKLFLSFSKWFLFIYLNK